MQLVLQWNACLSVSVHVFGCLVKLFPWGQRRGTWTNMFLQSRQKIRLIPISLPLGKTESPTASEFSTQKERSAWQPVTLGELQMWKTWSAAERALVTTLTPWCLHQPVQSGFTLRLTLPGLESTGQPSHLSSFPMVSPAASTLCTWTFVYVLSKISKKVIQHFSGFYLHLGNKEGKCCLDSGWTVLFFAKMHLR